MQLTFLQADKPLTKKYTRNSDGSYSSESYPMLFRVTSHTENVKTITEFVDALKKHAGLGHCLHTGSLDRPLENESRAGHHDKEETRGWVVLDLDGLKTFSGVEEFLNKLPEPFRRTSYVVQESPSAGIKPGIRAHVFFLLDRDENMQDIKTWIMHINLVTEELRDEITLTAKDFALSYPLDRVANDNGRVVYITAPECVGFDDPIKDRIRVVRKDAELLRYDFRTSTVSDVKRLERELVDQLRDAKGLTKSRVKDYYDDRGDIEVLKRKLTEPGRIHPVRKDSDIIMRCNLDDGDSEAYFYYISYPTFLRNHKGEPALYMEAVDKDYYDKIAMPEARATWEKDNQAFVFRDESTDKWYLGVRRGEEIVRQPNVTGAESKIQAWFKQHSPHVLPPDADEIETWDMLFDPTLDVQWNPEDRIFNTWRMTELMKNATYRSKPPEIVEKIIRHVTAGDEEYERFINWLACIYQNRNKTGTAWIFHGVQGTGKGLLVDHILTPIFGWDYVEKQQARNLKAEFNSFLEKALILNLDEFDVHHTGREADSVMQALKMWITDSKISIRRMYSAPVQRRNYTNVIITTNSPEPIPVPEGERRFNFGVRQEVPIKITHEEVRGISEELHAFAGFLKGYDADEELASVAMDNVTKQSAQQMSKSSIDEFAQAIRSGDLMFFHALLDEPSEDWHTKGKLKDSVARWITEAKEGRTSVVKATDMISAYMIATGDSKKTVTKFVKAMQHKNTAPTRRRLDDGTRPFAWDINWEINSEDAAALGLHLKVVNSPKVPNENDLKAPRSPHNIET